MNETLKNPRISQNGVGHTIGSPKVSNADTFETVYDYRKVNDQLKKIIIITDN